MNWQLQFRRHLRGTTTARRANRPARLAALALSLLVATALGQDTDRDPPTPDGSPAVPSPADDPPTEPPPTEPPPTDVPPQPQTEPPQTPPPPQTPALETGKPIVQVPVVPLDPADRDALVPGLIVTYQSTAQPQHIDTTRSPMAALYVGQDHSASSFLPAGPFTATLSGYVILAVEGRHTISMEGRGRCLVMLNDLPVLEGEGDLSAIAPAELELADSCRLEVRYQSPASGPARLRLFWQSANQPRQPLPASALFSDPSDQRLQPAERRREGRSLFVRLGCYNCHGGAEAAVGSPIYLPELDRQPPQLDDLKDRLNPSWLVQWILQPASLRSHATMPGLFAEPETAAAIDQAADLAAYLMGLPGRPEPPPEKALPDDGTFVAKGQQLFRQLSCQGCHAVTQDEQDQHSTAISLQHVALKFQPHALYRFLRDPRQHYAWSQMPDFGLSAEEASQLAAYLRDAADGELKQLQASGPPDPQRGQIVFALRGCANCHANPSSLDVEPLRFSRLEGQVRPAGCLATDAIARGDAPQYGITDLQRAALATFIRQDNDSLGRYVPAEEAGRLLSQLRCGVCHTEEPPPATGTQQHAAAGQQIPRLLQAGERLHTDWMQRYLGGERGARLRPWLPVRMPVFAARAPILATGLAAQHGLAPSSPPPFAVDPRLAEIGSQLFRQNTGFHCVQCHALGAKQPAANPQTHAFDLSQTAGRLRRESFDRLLLSPQLHAPGQNLPPAAEEGKSTANQEWLDGDASQQFNALWHFIHQQQETESADTRG